MSKDDGAPDAKPTGESRDVALIHGVTPEGDLCVLRRRDDRVELGAVRPLKEGVPIVGEVVRLVPRKEFPLLCDVTTELTVPKGAAGPSSDVPAPRAAPLDASARKGPAQVTSDEYRKNWDVIWSAPKPGSGLAN